jgi:putative ABC transport system permease protein
MSYLRLLAKNAFRNRFRTILTVTGVAVAILAFLFLRTVVSIWNSGVSAAAEDRLVTRHKISITMTLPRTYFNRIQDNIQGVQAITYANWFGAVYPKDERSFFANFAVDGETYFKVYGDIVVPPDQYNDWMADPAGAIVGPVVAAKYGWKIGDKVTLRGTIYPGDWTFTVRGFYDVTNKSFDKSTFVFHWRYLNEGVPESRREQVGWLAMRISDPTRGPQISQQIDKLFESSEAETLTESERAFNLSFLSMYSAIITAMDIVSIVVLLIMTMIVGNTIAMGVRERTHEYGVLRALGFVPRQLAGMVVGETLVIAVTGGLLGIFLATFLVNGFGAWVEDNMGNFFPYFRLETDNTILAGMLAVAVGLVSAAVPSLTVLRMNVTGALRRLG